MLWVVDGELCFVLDYVGTSVSGTALTQAGRWRVFHPILELSPEDGENLLWSEEMNHSPQPLACTCNHL